MLLAALLWLSFVGLAFTIGKEAVCSGVAVVGVSAFIAVSVLLNQFIGFDRFALPLMIVFTLGTMTRLSLSRRDLTWSRLRAPAASSLVGIPAMVLAGSAYFIGKPDGARAPTASADLLSFATTASWLEQHSYRSLLDSMPGTIGWSWLVNHVDFAFPIGDASVTNLMMMGVGDPLVGTCLAQILATGLIASASFSLLFGATSRLGRSCWGAVVVSCLVVNIENAFAVSLASQFGVAIFIGWIGLAGLFTDGTPPRWPAVLALTIVSSALMAVYPQFGMLAIPLAACVLILSGSSRPRFILAVTGSAAISPFSIILALRFLQRTATPIEANMFVSPFLSGGLDGRVLRWTGLGPLYTNFAPPTLADAATIVVLLAIPFIVSSRARRDARLLWLAVLFGFCGYLIFGHLVPASYSQFRLLKMSIPVAWLLLMVSVVPRRGRTMLVTVSLLVGLSLAGYLRNSNYLTLASVSDRTVDSSYRDLPEWHASLGAQEPGSEIVLLSDDFFTSHFATFELRDVAQLRYPLLPGGYLRGDAAGPWSGLIPRFLIIDRNASGYVEQGAIVRSNPRFLLVDSSRGRYAVFLKSTGADRHLGRHWVSASRSAAVEVVDSFAMFAATNAGEVAATLDCSFAPRAVAFTIAANSNRGPGYFSTRARVDARRTTLVPVDDHWGWAEVIVRPASPNPGCFLDVPSGIRIVPVSGTTDASTSGTIGDIVPSR